MHSEIRRMLKAFLHDNLLENSPFGDKVAGIENPCPRAPWCPQKGFGVTASILKYS
jgi:hypothetical protein